MTQDEIPPSSPSPSPPVFVIGGGPAGLMAAEVLSRAGLAVTVIERMATVGRKFMLAGRGGLNLTHSEPLDRFLQRYGDAAARLRGAIDALPPEALCQWSRDLGEETFIGSSGRIFPRSFKASPLLRAWLARLQAQGVQFRLRTRLAGWDEAGAIRLVSADGREELVPASATVLALGGASWPKLGADGSWVAVLEDRGVAITPLQAANCGLLIPWSEHFLARFEGVPLKSVAFTGAGQTARGEATVTKTGLEGGAIYQLSAAFRPAGDEPGKPATLTLDLKPDLALDALTVRLGARRGRQSLSSFLGRAASLSPVSTALLREAELHDPSLPPLASLEPAALAARIKTCVIPVQGIAGIERAISSAGGVALDQIDDDFMLTALPGVFVAGEMLDWEAPTGGYLLQASFSTGAAAAEGVLRWLRFRA